MNTVINNNVLSLYDDIIIYIYTAMVELRNMNINYNYKLFHSQHYFPQDNCFNAL